MKIVVRLACLSAFLLFCVSAAAPAQIPIPSIHQIESEQHRSDPVLNGKPAAAVAGAGAVTPRIAAVTKKIFGYHPYWASSAAYLSYDYGVLSTIGYFSYEVNAATGGYTTIRDWLTTPLIAYAHQRGVKVVLVATNFGADGVTAILSDTLKQNPMIAAMITLLTARGGDGVNIDFEGVPAAQRSNLVSFMRTL